MRTLAEIQNEFAQTCATLGSFHMQADFLKKQIDLSLTKLYQLEDESKARRLIDAEKAKEAEAEKVAEKPAEEVIADQ